MHNLDLHLRKSLGAGRGSCVPSDNNKALSEEYNYKCIFVILLPEAVDNILDLALFFSCHR